MDNIPIRPGAGPRESEVVRAYHESIEPGSRLVLIPTKVAVELTNEATGLMRRSGFYPSVSTDDPSTERFINGSDLRMLVSNPQAARQLVTDLRDLENAELAIETLGGGRTNYWQDRVFRHKYEEGNRRSTNVARLVEGAQGDGPKDRSGNSIRSDRHGIVADIRL